MDLTPAILEYVNKRISSLEKFVKNGNAITGQVEVGKTTNHHKQGDVFRSEFALEINGESYYAQSETSDLYVAIDMTREEIFRKLTDNKDRKQTLFKRGAMSVKKMLKGLSKRNPFTSKY